MNPKLSPEERADLVLKQMTLDEKIALLHGNGMAHAGNWQMPLTKLSNGGAGYVEGVARLGIPPLIISDAAYGVRDSGANGRYSTAMAVAAIRDGTKKSSDVKVSLSPATFDPNLKTFTVVGWNSVSRKITNRYNLVFTLRDDNTTIKKKAAKQVWLGICTKAVAKTEDAGKCDKDDD